MGTRHEYRRFASLYDVLSHPQTPIPPPTHTHITDAQTSLLYSMTPPNVQGAVSIRKTVLPGMAIPMLKIRRPNGRLIFNMEIAIRR